ncbi:squalene/phytoene synthase family protein [Galactobacter sp.]|uniref:phytoene/squalene synthase family protein n=1 Tax=Galactobacter sp. TaxID=2676125 RepID=UPI0025BEBF6C|nr:squalene/phytoene synthase family protein [Galactobacter sp.]
MSSAIKPDEALRKYTRAAERAADRIIGTYSTSFGAATRLLEARHRVHVRNIYGLVRVADELVDGAAAQAGVSTDQQLELLDLLERETAEAVGTGYSANPIVHAFAVTAVQSGIDTSLTAPFFASMRMDLRRSVDTELFNGKPAGGYSTMVGYDRDEHAVYVYGSAEVIGLMCLMVFRRDEHYSDQELQLLERGARSLGAAFQNVNFLRDLAEDTERLERSYLSKAASLTETAKSEWIALIRAQLADAQAVLPLLPNDARAAVDCARRLFSRLTEKISRTPLEQLLVERVRISDPAKAGLIVQSLLAATLKKPTSSLRTPRTPGMRIRTDRK